MADVCWIVMFMLMSLLRPVDNRACSISKYIFVIFVAIRIFAFSKGGIVCQSNTALEIFHLH